MNRLQPLHALDDLQLRHIEYLLFDVDETFTTHGQLHAETYATLFELQRAGIKAVPVTGRPSGWGNLMLSTWPIRACVTENGGVIAWKDDHQRMSQRIIHDEHRGAGYLDRLRALGSTIVQRFPQVRVSADQAYRLTDLAIDYNEHSKNVSEDTVNAIVTMLQDAGYLTAVSSIHIHAYFPRNEKVDGTYPVMQAAYGLNIAEVRARAAFIGDSPNDACLFAEIPLSIGVANVRSCLPQLLAAPAYVCEHSCGAGFIEFAHRLMEARL